MTYTKDNIVGLKVRHYTYPKPDDILYTINNHDGESFTLTWERGKWGSAGSRTYFFTDIINYLNCGTWLIDKTEINLQYEIY